MTLIKPLITEQSLTFAKDGRFSFAVEKDARRPEIKDAIEKTFGVKVVRVDIGKIPAKSYRSGRMRVERTKLAGKKAIVTLESGQKIDLFEVGEDAS